MFCPPQQHQINETSEVSGITIKYKLYTCMLLITDAKPRNLLGIIIKHKLYACMLSLVLGVEISYYEIMTSLVVTHPSHNNYLRVKILNTF